MRLGVLDVGSNTVHLVVVDAHRGAHPTPMHDDRSVLRLAEHVGPDDMLSKAGEKALLRAVQDACDQAAAQGCDELLALVTSAIREAANGLEVLARIRKRTGVDLQVLTGEEEARLTFLAVRRWFGWSAGQLLILDIGGGSLELASGIDEDPDVAVSLPLGAGRLTRSWFTSDPPHKDEIRKLRKHVRADVASAVGTVTRVGAPDQAVATSKTFRSLARVAGSAPSADGPYVRRTLHRDVMASLVSKLSGMDAAERARLPGVSAERATQLLAGAIVADAAMDLFEVESLSICPWALREGVILRRLDNLAART
jgi:exopolyphosphatase / guanosine-5'-triphosphate,3'-diphosphate pyrophosphatase